MISVLLKMLKMSQVEDLPPSIDVYIQNIDYLISLTRIICNSNLLESSHRFISGTDLQLHEIRFDDFITSRACGWY